MIFVMNIQRILVLAVSAKKNENSMYSNPYLLLLLLLVIFFLRLSYQLIYSTFKKIKRWTEVRGSDVTFS